MKNLVHTDSVDGHSNFDLSNYRNRQIQKLEKVNTWGFTTRNVYNKIDLSPYKAIETKYYSFGEYVPASIQSKAPDLQKWLLNHYMTLITIHGYDKSKPIVTDVNNVLIDGNYRLLATSKLQTGIWVKRLAIDYLTILKNYRNERYSIIS